MEFKRNPNSFNRNRLNVPGRSEPTRFTSAQPQQPPHRPAGQLFETDEPLIDESELEDISFRDIFSAWGRKAVKHSPIEKQLKAGKQKTERLKEMKNDLKWALMADLDEPVKPREKPSTPARPQHPHSPQHAVAPARQMVNDIARPGALPHHAQHATPTSTAKSIDININFGGMPKVPWHKVKAPFESVANFIRARSKKQLLLTGVVAFVLVFGFAAFRIQQNVAKYNPDGSLKVTSETIGTGGAPGNFKPVLPGGKTPTDFPTSGWLKTPNGGDPAFAYTDNFRGTGIKVTEQPIPERFKPDIASNVESMAKNFNANNKITVNSILVYIGTAHNGQQSIIFTKKDLLFLVVTNDTRNENDWAWYADNLQ